MSATPAFASTPRYGAASLTAANTNRDGTGTLVNILTGVAAGTLIPRIVVKSAGQPAPCCVLIWYFDGTTNWLFDEFVIGTTAAGSTTASAYRTERPYTDLVLSGATHILKASCTVVPTSGAINVETSGAADCT